ncbi:hypothetical protein GCM10011613_21630 [Cellvibrio zantedeschiae]|uniref:Uncharacterized protein n=1 Tax=Cellvibrio zantedeschiae TaxID=1237077 RepID=A0ABQ3B636_9GAMM|nr:hypothetical protein [Cellvibrio zantedeschiae]GGY76801.1 hypothetical protein GCM10011613_21630 [Cellvibrio zantedeschiae]
MSTNWIYSLASYIDRLGDFSSSLEEECMRLTIEGHSITKGVAAELQAIIRILAENNLNGPTILTSDGDVVEEGDLSDPDLLSGDGWRFILGKEEISQKLIKRTSEKTVIFFKLKEFLKWLDQFDPLEKPNHNYIDLYTPTTFIINGLSEPFGGPLTWVIPIGEVHSQDVKTNLPDVIDVHQLIHVVTSKAICISPRWYELSWGDFDSEIARKFMTLSSKVFAACLVHDLRFFNEKYEVSLNGTKRLNLPLSNGTEEIDKDFIKTLRDTIVWVYSERPETRLKLVMDRLSIDIPPGNSLISGMIDSLRFALQQARDAYAFVILDRKDAYHKEMRELMKDMKSQADIYASKVRDLIGSLTRDILGVLVFMGFSFIGKFDQAKIDQLLDSRELSLLTKVLAIYLLFSCALQLISCWRDSSLTYGESKKWVLVLQNYTSLDDIHERFLIPVEKRRQTLNIAMCLCGGLYGILALATWNLIFIVQLLLAQF